jgi:hypothetical protein
MGGDLYVNGEYAGTATNFELKMREFREAADEAAAQFNRAMTSAEMTQLTQSFIGTITAQFKKPPPKPPSPVHRMILAQEARRR